MSAPAYRLLLGDCLDVLKTLPDDSVDAVVTDPPYELAFMGKAWDAQGVAFRVDVWRECWRVLKPGGHLLAFGGTRTHHRIWCAIEDAGFDVRQTIMWLFASGFPKSLAIDKAIDKTLGAERAVTGERVSAFGDAATSDTGDGRNLWGKPATEVVPLRDEPATDEARKWRGFGTDVKPAYEPICVARKPLSEPSIARNVLRWGTGGINVDGCRVATSDSLYGGAYAAEKHKRGGIYNRLDYDCGLFEQPAGRWPPNVLLSCCGETPHADWCAAGELAEVARFFPTFRYEPKASRSERNAGCGGLPERRKDSCYGDGLNSASKVRTPAQQAAGSVDRGGTANSHPTVKPVALMRWLCRLVTPPGGTVLDCFAGSGTTGVAALAEGFGFVGIEREPEYHAIAAARLDHARDKAAPADLFAWAETAGG